VYRLFDVIERTATHRLDGSRHVSVTGNEDDRGVDTPREQFGLKLQPSHHRHAQIRQDAPASQRNIRIEKRP